MCLAFAPLAYSQATRQKVLIVGAGSAGLSAAYHLKRLGHDITLLEASGLVGGRVADQGLQLFLVTRKAPPDKACTLQNREARQIDPGKRVGAAVFAERAEIGVALS